MNSSFAEWLLRPFIDLGPCVHGPLCARGIEHYWLALIDSHRPKFALQRLLPRRFRNLALAEAGIPEYQADDPRDLPLTLRNQRWTSLCDYVDHWPELTSNQQCRLALVLHALCFYSVIVNCISETLDFDADFNASELAYRRASARYVLGLRNRVADYGDADLSQLEMIASTAPRGHPVALNAAMMVLVHKAKASAAIGEQQEWRAKAELNLEATLLNQDHFTSELLMSRFYRAAAFLPQQEGKRDEVTRMMDLAEQHARALVPANGAQNLLRLENLYPVIESRTKEALWLGDLDLALFRAESLVELDPYDSRAWLELGEVRLRRNEYAPAAEAYVVAATLGPPSTAIGSHMAGFCFRRLGQPLLAAFFFNTAIRTDLFAISPHDEIQTLPDLPVLAALKQWSLCTSAG